MRKLSVLNNQVMHLSDVNRGVVVFDLDGTLSNQSHRLDRLPTKDLHLTSSWYEFNRLAKYDSPFVSTIAVMNAMFTAGYTVIILTGRSEITRCDTVEWLRINCAKYDALIMRPAKDNRKDTAMKQEVIDAIGREEIVAMWDDNKRVIDHFRAMGITVYQVCDSDQERADLQSHGIKE